MFFCFKVLTGLKIHFCCQNVQIGIQTQFSPDMRACNLPCLPELTFVDLRLTDKMEKDGFYELSRSVWISNSQKFFPNTDFSLFFPLLFLHFASILLSVKNGSIILRKVSGVGIGWLLNDQQLFHEGQKPPRSFSGNVFLSKFISRICRNLCIKIQPN